MPSWRFGSIRSQLLSVLLALGLPFLGYFGVASLHEAREARAEMGEQMLGLARVTAARLDDHIGDIVQVLAVLTTVVDTGPQAAEHNDALLRKLATRLPAQTSNVSVWTNEGQNVGTVDPRARHVDVSGRKFFVDALGGREPAFEAPVLAGADDEAVGIFALPIERDGKILGVVSLTTRLTHLQQLLAPEGAGSAGRVTTVSDARGIVLARSIDPDRWIGRNLHETAGGAAESLAEREGVRDGPSADGIDRIAGFTMATRVPLLVYVGLPVDRALAGVRSRLRDNLTMGASLIALGIALALALARRIESPLQQLDRDTRAFGRGDLSHRSSVVGFAETRSLASTLNRMAEALQQRTRLLEASQSELRAMLDADIVGIIKLRERRIVWANAGAQRLLGHPNHELIGQSTRIFYADDSTYKEVGDEAVAVLRRGEAFRTQQPICTPHQSRVWLDIHATQLPGIGTPEVLAMLVDITPLRDAEEARVRALSLEAENRQLIESERLRSTLLANTSHEMRTPLNAVIGLSHLLRNRSPAADPARFRDYVEQIERNGRRLLAMINTMLALARTDTDRLEFRPAPVDVTAVILDAVDPFEADAQARKIVLRIDSEPGLGHLVVDPDRLAQVVSHLLSNAIKFSADGGVVTIRARREGAQAFRLEVEDRGIGIDAADLPRLFEPFTQLSEGSTKRYPGAGLGLALTRRIVEGQGGTVRVASVKGAGSTFTVILPCPPGPRTSE